jgi:hypothetical protein
LSKFRRCVISRQHPVGAIQYGFRRLFIVADSKFVQILKVPGDRV